MRPPLSAHTCSLQKLPPDACRAKRRRRRRRGKRTRVWDSNQTPQLRVVVLPRPLGAFYPHCRRRRRWDSHSRLLQAPRFESERVTAWLHVLGSRVPYDQRCSAWRLCHSRLSRLDRCAVCRWYHRCLRSRLCVHFDHLVQHTISGDRSLGKTTVRQTASQAVDNPATRRVNTRYCSFRLTTPLPDR